jgi:two-component system, cell cycle response regulator CtrA
LLGRRPFSPALAFRTAFLRLPATPCADQHNRHVRRQRRWQRKLAVNLDAQTVEVDGARVHLTGKEYAMLELLSLRKGTTLTKEMFLNRLYRGMDEPEIKIIDVFICKLRKKLSHACAGENYIETVWGRGYSLRELGEQVKAA